MVEEEQKEQEKYGEWKVAAARRKRWREERHDVRREAEEKREIKEKKRMEGTCVRGETRGKKGLKREKEHQKPLR